MVIHFTCMSPTQMGRRSACTSFYSTLLFHFLLPFFCVNEMRKMCFSSIDSVR